MNQNLQIVDAGDFKHLILELSRLDEYVKCFNENSKKYALTLNDEFFDESGTFDVLNKFNEIKRLNIFLPDIDPPNIDFAPLYELPGLESLGLGDLYSPIDIEKLKSLKRLYAQWSPKIKNLNRASAISELALWKYKTKTKGLFEILSLTTLSSLQLVQGNIATLSGISNLSGLNHLELHYMKGLEDISEIAKLPLTHLEIQKCAKIYDYDTVSQIESLESLSLQGTAPIPSLDFIMNLRNLKKMSILDSNVLDGNFDVCLEHPTLEQIAFNDKRHFNIKWEALNNALKSKTRSISA